MGEHKEKKLKEKKHRNKSKETQKEDDERKKHKIKAGQEQHQHKLTGAAAVTARVKPSAEPSEATKRILSVMFNSTSGQSTDPAPDPPEQLQGSRMKVRCPLDLLESRDGEDEEVWVLRLPKDVPVNALHGRTLHLPKPPPEARHLRPLQELLDDPTVDLLEYVKAHVRPQVIGHMRLGCNEAAVLDVGQFYELLQEDERAAKRLRVLAPATGRPSRSSKAVQSCQVARLLSVTDDVWTENCAMLSEMLEDDPAAAQQIGLDGGIPPRKFRKRIAGWKVLGKRPRQRSLWAQQQRASGSSSGDDADADSGLSNSDEEFEEIVFGEQQGDSRAAFSDEEEEQSESQLSAGSAQDADRQPAAAAADIDWDSRYYSSDSSSDDELLAEAEEEQEQDEALDALDVLGDHQLGVREFLLCLPILDAVAAQQAELYPSAAAGPTALAASPAGPQQVTSQQERRSPPADSSPSTPPADYSPSTPAVEAPGVSTDRSSEQPHKKQKQQQSPATASDAPQDPPAAAVADSADADDVIDWAVLNASYGSGSSSLPPPPPISQLCQLGWAEEQCLAKLGQQHRHGELRHFMRNYVTLFKTDMADVCFQIDMDRMSDGQVATLLQLLQLHQQREAAEGDEAEEMQARLLLPHKLSSRPHFTHTDQGYAPYQVSDAPPVLPSDHAEVLHMDAAWAELLAARGAGWLATLTDMEQLRARGFAWDSDPEEEQREGLHVTLPDGTTRHIPTGL